MSAVRPVCAIRFGGRYRIAESRIGIGREKCGVDLSRFVDAAVLDRSARRRSGVLIPDGNQPRRAVDISKIVVDEITAEIDDAHNHTLPTIAFAGSRQRIAAEIRDCGAELMAHRMRGLHADNERLPPHVLDSVTRKAPRDDLVAIGRLPRHDQARLNVIQFRPTAGVGYSRDHGDTLYSRRRFRGFGRALPASPDCEALQPGVKSGGYVLVPGPEGIEIVTLRHQ